MKDYKTLLSLANCVVSCPLCKKDNYWCTYTQHTPMKNRTTTDKIWLPSDKKSFFDFKTILPLWNFKFQKMWLKNSIEEFLLTSLLSRPGNKQLAWPFFGGIPTWQPEQCYHDSLCQSTFVLYHPFGINGTTQHIDCIYPKAYSNSMWHTTEFKMRVQRVHVSRN